MESRLEFNGTASELFSAMSDSKVIEKNSGIGTNNLTRKIKENLLTLEKTYNVKVSFNRTNSARLIFITKVTNDSIFIGEGSSPKTLSHEENISDSIIKVGMQ
jgi:hypothetical protein